MTATCSACTLLQDGRQRLETQSEVLGPTGLEYTAVESHLKEMKGENRLPSAVLWILHTRNGTHAYVLTHTCAQNKQLNTWRIFLKKDKVLLLLISPRDKTGIRAPKNFFVFLSDSQVRNEDNFGLWERPRIEPLSLQQWPVLPAVLVTHSLLWKGSLYCHLQHWRNDQIPCVGWGCWGAPPVVLSREPRVV